MSCQYCPWSRIVAWKREPSHWSEASHSCRAAVFCEVVSEQGTCSCTHMHTLTHVDTTPPLTVIRVVPYNVVSSTPVPQEESGVSGAWHDVAVSSDVGLWSGQTRHHIPVAKNYLGQLSYGEEGQRWQRVPSTYAFGGRGFLTTRIKIHFTELHRLIKLFPLCRSRSQSCQAFFPPHSVPGQTLLSRGFPNGRPKSRFPWKTNILVCRIFCRLPRVPFIKYVLTNYVAKFNQEYQVCFGISFGFEFVIAVSQKYST